MLYAPGGARGARAAFSAAGGPGAVSCSVVSRDGRAREAASPGVDPTALALYKLGACETRLSPPFVSTSLGPGIQNVPPGRRRAPEFPLASPSDVGLAWPRSGRVTGTGGLVRASPFRFPVSSIPPSLLDSFFSRLLLNRSHSFSRLFSSVRLGVTHSRVVPSRLIVEVTRHILGVPRRRPVVP